MIDNDWLNGWMTDWMNELMIEWWFNDWWMNDWLIVIVNNWKFGQWVKSVWFYNWLSYKVIIDESMIDSTIYSTKWMINRLNDWANE